MEHVKIQLRGKQADAYRISLGLVNLVFLFTDKALIGCGAFNVAALDKFNYPAAVARSADGAPIATEEDIVGGFIKEANAAAIKLGIKVDMPVKEALELM